MPHAGSGEHNAPTQDETGRWIVHGQRPIYDNQWVMRVGFAGISLPTGERFEHHTVTLPAAAMTVVSDDAGEHLSAYIRRTLGAVRGC